MSLFGGSVLLSCLVICVSILLLVWWLKWLLIDLKLLRLRYMMVNVGFGSCGWCVSICLSVVCSLW